MQFESYLAKLTARIQELGAKQHRFYKYSINPPIDPEAIQQLEKDFLCTKGETTSPIWEPIKEFYSFADGFTLSWIYSGRPEIPRVIAGNTNISSILTIYNPFDEVGNLNESFFTKYHVLDWIGEENHVALRFSKKYDEPELYYFDVNNGYFLMSIGFVTYMKLLSEARAMYPWQEFFIADQRFAKDEQQRTQFLENLAMLFPDVNPSLFPR